MGRGNKNGWKRTIKQDPPKGFKSLRRVELYSLFFYKRVEQGETRSGFKQSPHGFRVGRRIIFFRAARNEVGFNEKLQILAVDLVVAVVQNDHLGDAR